MCDNARAGSCALRVSRQFIPLWHHKHEPMYWIVCTYASHTTHHTHIRFGLILLFWGGLVLFSTVLLTAYYLWSRFRFRLLFCLVANALSICLSFFCRLFFGVCVCVCVCVCVLCFVLCELDALGRVGMVIVGCVFRYVRRGGLRMCVCLLDAEKKRKERDGTLKVLPRVPIRSLLDIVNMARLWTKYGYP